MLRKFLAIVEDTIREGLAKKTILGMLIVSAFSILLAALFFHSNSGRLLLPATQHVQASNGNHPANVQSLQLLGATVLDVMWLNTMVMLLIGFTCVGVFATAGFITSIMEKGSIDLLLSKPVPRWVYVVGRYSGAVFIVFVEVSFLVVGLWIAASSAIGTWDPTFLLSAFFITLCFAGVYGLVTLIGILTRSSWFAIILGLVLFVVSLVISIVEFFVSLVTVETQGGFLKTATLILRWIVPSAVQMGGVLAKLLTRHPADLSVLLIPVAIASVYVGLSCYAFSKKEF